MTYTNRQVRLRARPDGIPQTDHFEIVDVPLGILAAGRFRVKNLYLSVDPAMRGWVSAVANYSKPVGVGEVMRSFAVGEIVESRESGGFCEVARLGRQSAWRCGATSLKPD